MDRPTKEVKLPVSGIIAIVYAYFLRGERKQIENIMFESAKFVQDETGKPKLDRVDTSYRIKMEDKAVLLAVKKLTGKDGKDIPISIENLDSLPNEDYEILQDALPKPKEVKKK